MKKLLLALVLLLSIGFSQKAFAYDFWAVNNNGDTIFYRFIAGSDSTVQVTYEGTIQIFQGWVTVSGKGYNGDITIPSTVTFNGKTYTVSTIGEYAFYNGRITSITLPGTIATIESHAFEYCENLNSINFSPTSTTEMVIGETVCYHCYNLKYINIPDYVTSIGSEAFLYSGLKGVILGNSISHIGDYACPSEVVICNALNPPVAGRYSLGDISSTIIVPCESVEAYRSAPNLDIYDYSTCIGLEDLKKEELEFIAYPNPAKDNITIQTKQLKGGSLFVYDIMGKEVLSAKINNDETNLSLNNLKAGVYILKVLNSENLIVGNKKIIKQ